MTLFDLLDAASDSATGSSAATEAVGTGGFNYMWIMFGVLAVLMIVYFIISNNRRKKQEKEINQMMDALKPGDKVLTIGRWIGEIVEVLPDGNFVVKSGTDDHPGYLTIEKSAIAHIYAPEPAPQEDVPTELPPSDEVYENGDVTTETAEAAAEKEGE